MTATTNIRLPYLEGSGDRKKLYTPKEWIERLRHNIKRIHNVDIKQTLVDDTTPTDDLWETKEPETRQDFIWNRRQSN